MSLLSGWLVDAVSRLRKRPSSLPYFLVLVGLLAFGWQTRSNMIDASVPYCMGNDEAHWTKSAMNMLRTGEWNPHRFTKPSVQVYLARFGLSLGVLRSDPEGQEVDSPRELEGDAYPFYRQLMPILTARQLFAWVSMGALALGAFLVQRLTGSRVATGVALLLATLSPYYFWMSWSYVNADIVGVFFAIATIAYLVVKAGGDHPYRFAAIAGVLCGLTVGSKYNLFPVLLPATVALFLFHRRQWVPATLLLGTCSVVTFLATTPYAVLDYPAFMHSLKFEAHHYATGHRGRTFGAGIPMFTAYGKDLVVQLGWGVIGLGVLGAFALVRRDARRAALVLTYPLVLLVYMSMQRTFFERNLLIWYLLLPLLVGPGVVFAYESLERLTQRHIPQVKSLLAHRVLAVLVPCFVLGAGVPWARIAKAFDERHVESRNEVIPWLIEALPRKTELLVPKQLAFDARPLEKQLTVRRFDAKGATIAELQKKYPKAVVLVPEFAKDRGKHLDLEDLGKGYERLSEFGQNALKTEHSSAHRRVIYAPKGNPRFAVVQL